MPFASQKQRRFMFLKHPQIARRWTKEAKDSKTPVVKRQVSAWGVDHGYKE